MNTLKSAYAPTLLQQVIGGPLRSEQRTGEYLPPVLSRRDLLVLLIAIVLFIPNCSFVQATPGGGGMAYVHWIIETAVFLIPGAIVAGQLNRFMPADGAIYVWTHRAIGPLWGFFAGFCTWLAGILAIVGTAISVVYLSQGIFVQIGNIGSNWLIMPWQQGCVVLGVLFFAGWFATFRLRFLLQLAKGIVLLYGIVIGAIGLAGLVWLVSGHHAQTPLSISTTSLGKQNIIWYGVIILALSGVEVPLNLAAEVKQRNAAAFAFRWGVPIVLISYLLGTFGIMMVVPPGDAMEPYSVLTAVSSVFGPFFATLAGVILVALSIIVTVLYNMAFARILFASALDQRLPSLLARVNRFAAPSSATTIQTIIALAIALFTYFIGPLLYPGEGLAFSDRIFVVSQAVITILWCISTTILFLDLPVLLKRFGRVLAQNPGQLIAPSWVLYLCSGVGALASVMAIVTTLNVSWDSQLIADQQWRIIIAACTLSLLMIGLIGSAYPRLLSNLEEQTKAARENAHLYQQLQAAYTKLREADQLKDAFLVTAAHELRTPLTIIEGYLELLRIMEDAPADLRCAFFEKACRATEELALLLSNIMDASRIEFDAASLRCQTLVVKEVVTAVADLFEPVILRDQRHTVIDIDPQLRVWADEIRFKQVLHNLLSNALRYSPPQTTIDITAVSIDSLVRISIRDHGSGIPPNRQKAIFDKFVRLERDMHGTVRGSGLGLFITKTLVEAMDGTITVESSGIEHEGSTFSIVLPTGRADAIAP